MNKRSSSRHFASTHYRSSPDKDTTRLKPPAREAKLAILAKVKKSAVSWLFIHVEPKFMTNWTKFLFERRKSVFSNQKLWRVAKVSAWQFCTPVCLVAPFYERAKCRIYEQVFYDFKIKLGVIVTGELFIRLMNFIELCVSLLNMTRGCAKGTDKPHLIIKLKIRPDLIINSQFGFLTRPFPQPCSILTGNNCQFSIAQKSVCIWVSFSHFCGECLCSNGSFTQS